MFLFSARARPSLAFAENQNNGRSVGPQQDGVLPELTHFANRNPVAASESLVLIDVQEVLVGIHAEFAAGHFIAGDDGVGMQVEGGDGPHLVHLTFLASK